MSRIHEALQKARQQELGTASGLPNLEEIVSSESGHDEQERAGDIGSNALPTAMLEPVVEEKPRATPGTSLPREKWPQFGNHLVFFGDHASGQEQFRTLRSRLHQMRRGRSLQVLAVSSALPTEGKSFISANLAHAVALQSERGALVIDADLRRAGGLSAVLECPTSPGLSEHLRGELGTSEVIHTGSVPKLYAIPSGRRVDNSGELVGTLKFSALIETLRATFDWIIIDTPPVIPIADARAIAECSDGVLLVIDAQSTLADLAKRAIQEFRKDSLLGVVLNRASGASAAYYSSYDYRYGYGSEQRMAKAK